MGRMGRTTPVSPRSGQNSGKRCVVKLGGVRALNKFGLIFVAITAAMVSSRGEDLTLLQAIELAKRNNGVLASASAAVASARSGVREANAAFLPFVTPSYEFSDIESKSSINSSIFRSTDHTAGIDATWTVLDAGQRQYAYGQAKKQYEATRYSSLWTMRQVLFSVTQQFYAALRAQELMRTAEAQVVRTKEVLEVVKKRVELGDAAKKDILQAEADVANAEVDLLTAGNDVDTAEAGLKAIIGWREDQALPDLGPSELAGAPTFETLDEALKDGISKRPDVTSALRDLESTRYNVLLAERDASLDWSLRVNYGRTVEPRDTFNRTLTFVVSYPLFDGGLSRERVKQAQLGYKSNKALYDQQLRDAKSEIEAAFLVWKQNRLRLDASTKALKAAQVNFDAVSESHRLGAASIQEVTTARLTLITAETNQIQAVYDQYISDVRFRLVTGDPLPGEN